MTNTQLFFSLLGVLVAIFGSQTIMLKMYMDAKIDGKIDPLAKQVDLLVQYMISHEGRLATLDERTKGKG
jgi:hypothetical protein